MFIVLYERVFLLEKIKKYTLNLIIAIVALLGLGLTIGSMGTIPDNAIVYVDTNTNVFYSPLSLTQEKVTALDLKENTLRNAKTLGYIMDEGDKQNGYFYQNGRSLTGIILEKLGILPKLKGRVDSNGNWLY